VILGLQSQDCQAVCFDDIHGFRKMPDGFSPSPEDFVSGEFQLGVSLRCPAADLVPTSSDISTGDLPRARCEKMPVLY
jgi:hypothetical protein